MARAYTLRPRVIAPSAKDRGNPTVIDAIAPVKVVILSKVDLLSQLFIVMSTKLTPIPIAGIFLNKLIAA
ncbi:hypothetical protein BSPWISOXPB_3076 [uncultured Gammaproteobacteria bacterium]|nr:hypothetical protein BSPWISOXPB_3076 [uncultured Gammaproteobacteria bacterium]